MNSSPTEPKEGEAPFAPKIIEGVHSVSAPDGSQVTIYKCDLCVFAISMRFYIIA